MLLASETAELSGTDAVLPDYTEPGFRFAGGDGVGQRLDRFLADAL